MSVEALVPLAHVRDVERSIAFYTRLGFEVGNTHVPEGARAPVWAWLRRGRAQLMLGQAGEPVEPERQAVLFYLYCADVEGFRAALLQAGLEAGEIKHPFWAPRGEFRLEDPDGYVLMITHT
jgi:catechol 2,3-dioxygenase-like lactoylglutathione lyase family enzyme